MSKKSNLSSSLHCQDGNRFIFHVIVKGHKTVEMKLWQRIQLLYMGNNNSYIVVHFFYFDSVEYLPIETLGPEDVVPLNCHYDAQISVFAK